VALFGTIFIRSLENDLAAQVGPEKAAGLLSGGGQFDPTTLAALPDAVKLPIFRGIATALSDVFVWAIPFAAVVALLAWFIKEVALRTHDDVVSPADQGENDKATDLVSA
jgi:hypothetical protein